MPLGLTNCGLCARYAGDWTDDGTDFVGKSGVFWPDFGTVSGPLAALVTHKLADGVVERAGVIWHVCLQ